MYASVKKLLQNRKLRLFLYRPYGIIFNKSRMNQEYYNNRIAENTKVLQQLIKKNRIILITRITFFVGCAISLWILIKNDYSPITLSILISQVILFLITIKIDLLLNAKILYHKSLNDIFDKEIEAIEGKFERFDAGSEYINQGHEYSFDLDIFGNRSFFHRLDRTVTPEGKRELVNKLTNLLDSKEAVIERQNSIKELRAKINFCHCFMAYGAGVNKKMNSLISYLPAKSSINNKGLNKLTNLLYSSVSLTLISCFLAYFQYISAYIPSVLFFVQLLASIIVYKRNNKNLSEIENINKNSKKYVKLLAHVLNEKFEDKTNHELKNKLLQPVESQLAFKKLSSLLNKFDNRENSYAFIILNGLFLQDLFLLINYAKWKKKYLSHIPKWLEVLGEFDSLISLANYSFNKPEYIIPEIISDNRIKICAQNIGHPFIDKNKVVKNSFRLENGQLSIITGANMSGKSTFLRTLGINYIMALNGLTVCASSFRCSIMSVFSSMRNSDDLVSGKSYFSAELDRLEKLIRYCKTNHYTLILLDEILKGTNSKDKLSGSILFLREILKKNVSGIIATHDLALTEIQKEMPELIRNYYFDFHFGMDDKILYDYKIKHGVSTSFNATYLLNKILI